jgi:nicotinamidase-related amidase
MLAVPHCLEGTPGHALYGEVASLAGESDRRFIKHSFGSGELYEYLKKTAFAGIELVGVVSNICVLANAVLAKTAQPETPVTVDASCTAGNDPALHAAALNVMRAMQVVVRK